MDNVFALIKTTELKGSTFRSRILDFGDFDISDAAFNIIFKKAGNILPFTDFAPQKVGNTLVIPYNILESYIGEIRMEVWMTLNGIKDLALVDIMLISAENQLKSDATNQNVSVTFGDVVIPVTFTQAIVNIGEATGGGGAEFPEAPNDGKYYARKNLGWEEVVIGSGGIVGKYVKDVSIINGELVIIYGGETTETDNTAPSVPTGLTSSNISENSFTVTWANSTDNVAVTGYEIYINGVFYSTVSTNSANISGRLANTVYSVTVLAKDEAGNKSAQSDALSVTTSATADTTVPTAPTGLTVSGISANSLILSWTASTDNIGVAGYDVYQNGTKIKTVTTNETNITGLSAATAYTFYVIAKDVAGNASVASATVNTTTTSTGDTAAPTIPINLTSSNITSSGFTVTWTISTDNIGVTGYEVYLDGVLYSTVTTNSVIVTGRNAYAPYSVTVLAKDAAGNKSAQSNALIVTTAAAPDVNLVDPSMIKANKGIILGQNGAVGTDVNYKMLAFPLEPNSRYELSGMTFYGKTTMADGLYTFDGTTYTKVNAQVGEGLRFTNGLPGANPTIIISPQAANVYYLINVAHTTQGYDYSGSVNIKKLAMPYIAAGSGKNLFVKTNIFRSWGNFYTDTSKLTYNTALLSTIVPVQAATQYVISGAAFKNVQRIAFYTKDANGAFVMIPGTWFVPATDSGTYTVTAPAAQPNGIFLIMSVWFDSAGVVTNIINTLQIEAGSTPTSYVEGVY